VSEQWSWVDNILAFGSCIIPHRPSLYMCTETL